MEPVIVKNLSILINVIDDSVGSPLPALYWFRLLAVDIIGLSMFTTQLILGELSFGESFGALKSGITPNYIHDSDTFFLLANLNISFAWFSSILWLIPLSWAKHIYTAQERLAAVFTSAFFVDSSMGMKN
jgi:hypothetical protein